MGSSLAAAARSFSVGSAAPGGGSWSERLIADPPTSDRSSFGPVHTRRAARPRSAALLGSGFLDEFVEHLPHRHRVAVHDGGGCCDVAVGVEVLPVEDEAGVAGELLEEGTLRPAVALAERVDGVDL